MSDQLRTDIERALSGTLDGNVFEACAADLLSEIYRALVPVSGGTDYGQDAAIGVPGEPPWPLICTTSTRTVDNLRKNLQSYVDHGGQARRAVFATSQMLSGKRRSSLQAAAAELGFALDQLYDRSYFTQALYRHDAWRRDLLGLSGRPSALSAFPRSRRVMLPASLVGRAALLEEVRNTSGDLVIYGEPGIGKTFLLQSLVDDGWGLFLVDSEAEALADAMRREKPRRIIVDDAHFQPETLDELRRLRSALDVDFDIVATSWPDWPADVSSHLPGAVAFSIPRLPRSEMLDVIVGLGLTGSTELQRLIIDQAEGRAGLAATLVRACFLSGVQEVVRGDVLLREVAASLTEAGRDSEVVTLLGLMALSDRAGITMESLAEIAHGTLPAVRDDLLEIASGGVIDMHLHRDEVMLTVQPATLRYSLVDETFFSGAGSLSVTKVLDQFPDPTVALMPLIAALHRKSGVDDELVRSLLALRPEAAALKAYAALGDPQARYALKLATDVRTRGDVAEAALDAAPSVALRELLQLSAHGERPGSNTADDGMSRIADHAQRREDSIRHRRQVFEAARAWLADGQDPNVALEAMAVAVDPKTRGGWLDPGEGLTYTIQEGALPPSALGALSPMWDELIEVASGTGITRFAPIFTTLHHWCFPSYLIPNGRLEERHVKRMRKEARRVVRRLAEALPERLGVLAALGRLNHRARLRIQVAVPDDVDALYPRRDFPPGEYSTERHTELMERQRARVRHLAELWLASSPTTAARRLALIEGEVALGTEIPHPRHTPYLCEVLADQAERPERYLRALRAAQVPPDLLLPFIGPLIDQRPREWKRLLYALIDDPVTKNAVLSAVLSLSVSAEIRSYAVEACDASTAWMIEHHAFGLTDDALRQLLTHGNEAVVRGATIGAAMSGPSSLSSSTREAWEAAIVRCPADDFWVSHRLQENPALVGPWIEGWIERCQATPYEYERLPDSLLDTVKALPLVERVRTLREFPTLHDLVAGELVSALVGDDVETVEIVFERDELESARRAALSNGPSTAWLDRASVALDAGWEPERVVGAVGIGPSVTTFRGDESAHWQTVVDSFEELAADPAAEPHRALIEAGLKLYGQSRDAAATREHRERVHGR